MDIIVGKRYKLTVGSKETNNTVTFLNSHVAAVKVIDNNLHLLLTRGNDFIAIPLLWVISAGDPEVKE